MHLEMGESVAFKERPNLGHGYYCLFIIYVVLKLINYTSNMI